MSKSAHIIEAEPFRRAIKNKKTFTRKMTSVKQTYQSQLKADPMMELRRSIQMAGMERRIAEARAAKVNA